MNPVALLVFDIQTPGTKTMDTDHEIDVAVAAVETELQIEREKRERENNSKTAEALPNSKTGCLMMVIYFLVGISLLRICGEIFGILLQ